MESLISGFISPPKKKKEKKKKNPTHDGRWSKQSQQSPEEGEKFQFGALELRLL